MSLFDLSGVIFGAVADNAHYNGHPIKVFIDLDAEVESEGGVFVRKNMAHVPKPLLPKTPERGDQILHNGTAYSVESLSNDDGDVVVLLIKRQANPQ